MGDHTSARNPSAKEDRPAVRSEGLKKTYKATKTDDVISTVTGNSLIAFRKIFHFPNDMILKVLTKSDRASSPPQGFVTVYEFSLRAGLRFPPSPELIDVLAICGAVGSPSSALPAPSLLFVSFLFGFAASWFAFPLLHFFVAVLLRLKLSSASIEASPPPPKTLLLWDRSSPPRRIYRKSGINPATNPIPNSRKLFSFLPKVRLHERGAVEDEEVIGSWWSRVW